MNLIPEEGAYMLIIDSKLPLASVVLQSKQNIDIIQIKDNLAKINIMRNIPDPNVQSLAQLLIEGESKHNRLEIKIRTSEGQQGNIQVIILPRDSQACQNLEVPLKPLNLHEKINEIEITEDMLLSTIKIKSKNLDIEDSLLWISNILPDVPSFVDERKDQVTFSFKSSFVGSILIVTLYKSKNGEGELTIQTDNYSVLTIMKVSNILKSL